VSRTARQIKTQENDLDHNLGAIKSSYSLPRIPKVKHQKLFVKYV